MRLAMGTVCVLVVLTSGWANLLAKELGLPAAPAVGPTAKAAAPAKDVSAKPADDPAAQRKAREEAARQAQAYARTRRTMMTAKPKLDFQNIAIKQVLTTLAEAGSFSVVFDAALEEAGMDLSVRTATINTTGMTYEDAINLILPKECGYRIEAGYVLVTTLEKSYIPLKTGVYGIQLALAEIPNFEGPRFAVGDIIARSAQTGGGGGGGLFTQSQTQAADTSGRATPERIIDFIKKFVKNQNDRRIAPWDDEGGPATIQYLGGRLVITQTDHGHRAIAKLLAAIE